MFRLGSRHWVRSKVFLAAGGTAAILLGAGGTALAVSSASVPVSKGQVHGCYTRTSGALRVLTARAPHCKAGEKVIAWPSVPNSINGYAATFKFNHVSQALTINLKPVVAIKLAPGSSYIVSATTDLDSIGPAAFDWAQCELLDGKTVIGYALTTIPFDSGIGGGFSTLSSAAYSPKGGTITMECSDQLGQATVFNWNLTATQVSHLTLGPASAGAAPRGGAVKLPSTR